MKKVFLLTLVLAVTMLAFNFYSPEPTVLNNVTVQFVATNGYGNNVYVTTVQLKKCKGL